MIENKYYRFLNLPFEFNMAIPEFGTANHVTLKVDDLPGPFIEFLAARGVKIGFAEAFKKHAGYEHELALHIDGHKFDNHVKINFVVNNGQSTMCWWQVKDPTLLKTQTTVVKTDYYYAAESDCDLVAEAVLDRPALVNAGQLHSIKNIAGETRYAFSFMLTKQGQKLLWNDAIELFKDYLE